MLATHSGHSLAHKFNRDTWKPLLEHHRVEEAQSCTKGVRRDCDLLRTSSRDGCLDRSQDSRRRALMSIEESWGAR